MSRCYVYYDDFIGLHLVVAEICTYVTRYTESDRSLVCGTHTRDCVQLGLLFLYIVRYIPGKEEKNANII